jgi:hypothetical protein
MESFNYGTSAMAIMDSTGPYHLSRALEQAMQSSRCGVALPNTYFYPISEFSKDRILGEDFNPYLGPNTYACHLWHCSWLKQRKKGCQEGRWNIFQDFSIDCEIFIYNKQIWRFRE